MKKLRKDQKEKIKRLAEKKPTYPGDGNKHITYPIYHDVGAQIGEPTMKASVDAKTGNIQKAEIWDYCNKLKEYKI